MKNVLERVINLLAFLLTVGRPATADEIRNTVAGYDRDNDEAFRRMFERDKELLRGLGIPLETEHTDAWEIDVGYRVEPGEYEIPDPGLTDEERTALWLASRIVQLGGQPSGPEAIFKLGGAPEGLDGEVLAADLGAEADLLGEIFQCVVDRRTLRFEYREKIRDVAPLGLVHRRGHWYLVGVEAGDSRAYRVDRGSKWEPGAEADAFERPPGLDLSAALADVPWETGDEPVQAVVRFDEDIAWWARRRVPANASIEDAQDGAIDVTLPVANADPFLGWVIGFGSAARIMSPRTLRESLTSRVQEALA